MTPSGYFLTHLWLVPLFPLITAALMLIIGRRLPKAAVSFLCVGSVFLSFLHATGAVLGLRAAPPGNRVFQLILFEWITPGVMPSSTRSPPSWSSSSPASASSFMSTPSAI